MSKLDYQVASVFLDPKAGEPAASGNLLAVFTDGAGLSPEKMQVIAHDLKPPSGDLENFSETSFVTSCDAGAYSVRIFTPREELGFAGHPTLGTAWVLRHLGLLEASQVTQSSKAGETHVTFQDDSVWFRRGGEVGRDLRATQPETDAAIAEALGLGVGDVGLEPRELGRSVNRLHPAVADAGMKHLIVPLKDAETLGRCRPVAHLLDDLSEAHGAYCFTATGAGSLRSRGFFPSLGIEEDPATGSAGAALGLYLAARVGPIGLEIQQGVEMGRPSLMQIKAASEAVEIGGGCRLIFEGSLTTVP